MTMPETITREQNIAAVEAGIYKATNDHRLDYHFTYDELSALRENARTAKATSTYMSAYDVPVLDAKEVGLPTRECLCPLASVRIYDWTTAALHPFPTLEQKRTGWAFIAAHDEALRAATGDDNLIGTIFEIVD